MIKACPNERELQECDHIAFILSMARVVISSLRNYADSQQIPATNSGSIAQTWKLVGTYLG